MPSIISNPLQEAQYNGVVIGLKEALGTKVPRREIDDLLLNEPDAFNIFMIALWELQQDKQRSEKMGYYQIAGIHGLPKQPWDGVFSPQKLPENREESGYCVHSELTFPTWHRPYLALMEQTIYNKMNEIVQKYPGEKQQKYRDAITKWRLPYWDFHRPRGGHTKFSGVVSSGSTEFDYDYKMPDIFTVDKVMLRTPTADQLEPHPNPLRQFTFPKKGMSERIPDNQWTIFDKNLQLNQDHTYRTDGNNNLLNETLNNEREAATEMVIQFMSGEAYSDYKAIASNKASEGPSGSLEGLHNKYHSLIGGEYPSKGHMGAVAVAAFDPVFWFYHCQIDRLFAIWQAINPKAWFPSDSANNTLQQSDLLPFRASKQNDNSEGNLETFWNSDASRDTENFGYYYEDAVVGSAQNVKAEFLRKYQWSARAETRTNEFGHIPDDMLPLDVARAQTFQYTSGSPEDAIIPPVAHVISNVISATTRRVTSLTTSATQQNRAEGPVISNGDQSSIASTRSFVNAPEMVVLKANQTPINELQVSRAWYVDQLVERHALNGTFITYFFIGDFENNSDEYAYQPTLAGRVVNFAAPVEACASCERQNREGHKVTDTVAITPMLLDYVKIGLLETLEPRHVCSFLEKNLKWRICRENGEVVNPRIIESLKIGVSSKVSPITPATGDVLYQEFPDVIEHIIKESS